MSKVVLIALVYGAIIFTSTLSARAEATNSDNNGCIVNVEKEGGETTKVCDDGVTIGGDIKDVSIETPLGGKNAAIPKAGKDAERVVRGAGEVAKKAEEKVRNFARKLF